jgi:hypothetical protein
VIDDLADIEEILSYEKDRYQYMAENLGEVLTDVHAWVGLPPSDRNGGQCEQSDPNFFAIRILHIIKHTVDRAEEFVQFEADYYK